MHVFAIDQLYLYSLQINSLLTLELPLFSLNLPSSAALILGNHEILVM